MNSSILFAILSDMEPGQIAAAIRQALAEKGTTAYRASLDAGLPGNAIRYALEGRATKSQRLAEICDALGLELYVGPPREQKPPSAHMEEAAPPADIVDPPPWAGALREEIAGVREEVKTTSEEVKALLRRFGEAGYSEEDLQGMEEFAAQYDGDADVFDTEEAPGTRSVTVVALTAAAVAGAEVLDEEVIGSVWFSKGWLRRQELDADQCLMIRVCDESMEPEFHDGSWVLVDRQRTDRVVNDVYVVRLPDDGVVVRRAGRGEDGSWTMLSEHPSWEPVPWPRDAVTIGQVVWTARSLI